MTDSQFTPDSSNPKPTEPASSTDPAAIWQRPETPAPVTPSPVVSYGDTAGGGIPPYTGAPAWAVAQQPPAPRQDRTGKFILGTALAAILALSSGLVGGVIGANYFGGKDVVNTTTVQAAPAIDRTSLASIAAAVQPSVVSIKTEGGEGSGVIMSADGYILTNNHVVATARGNTVSIVMNDGTKLDATIVGTDPRSDLAVVKASGSAKLTPAKFADSSAVLVGDTVLAIGSPLGLEGSVTEGIISAKERTITISGTTMTGLLQTDAAINPGNSGGALVNTKGEVVGINSAIATNGGSEGNIGVGFAIPSAKAKTVAEQLQKGQKVNHVYLGVKVGQDQAGAAGAVISDVTAGGPAEKAGLKVGDVVTKFGDTAIETPDELVAAVQSRNIGDQVQISFTRNGASQTTTVTLGSTS
jgi:putative serine protease PepD